MVIDIKGLPSSSVQGTGSGPSAPAERKPAAGVQQPTRTGGSGDTVSLTSTASQLRALEAGMSSLPVVNLRRVDEVKQAVSDGSFVIDPVEVADKIVEFEYSITQTAGKNDGR